MVLLRVLLSADSRAAKTVEMMVAMKVAMKAGDLDTMQAG